MEKHEREDKQPDKPFDPLEAGTLKHCDLMENCLDNCNACLFNALYHLKPKEGKAPNEWEYGDLATNPSEYDG